MLLAESISGESWGFARMHWTRATASIGTVPWARGPLLSRSAGNSTQQDGHMVWSRPSPEVSLKVLELPTRVVSSLACRCGSKCPINMEVLADLSPQYCRLVCLQIGYPYIWCLITIFLTHNLSLVGSVPIFLPLLSHEFCMSISLMSHSYPIIYTHDITWGYKTTTSMGPLAPFIGPGPARFCFDVTAQNGTLMHCPMARRGDVWHINIWLLNCTRLSTVYILGTSNLILNPCARLRIVVLRIAAREWFSCNCSCASYACLRGTP